MILASLVMALVMVINAACGEAARSMVDTVCALSGRSVLSEYQRDLFDDYGVFAVRGDDALLTRLASFYINGSLIHFKALVRPYALKISASSESHPALDTAAFGKQVRRLAPGAALTKGRVLEYIMSFSDREVSDASEIPVPEGSEDMSLQEASESAEKSFGKDADSKSGSSIKNSEYRMLPSRLLGYPRRVSLVLSGGIKDLSFAAVIEDEYILAVCSDTLHKKSGRYLQCETEYVLYGNPSDAANRRALKMSLFTLRMAVNEIKYLSETGELLISTAASAAVSIAEVRTLLAGGKADGLGLDTYLRILLALVPRSEKLARLMDVMELNIKLVKGANFAFKNYAYGFDLDAVFILKKRLGDVSTTFVYR